MEVAINEISKTLFAQRLKNTTQPFFPNAAKDLFGAVLAHFSRNQGSFYCDNRAMRQFMDAMPTAQLREMLEKGGATGRKLDFLIQEFNREANTIGSKCSDIETPAMWWTSRRRSRRSGSRYKTLNKGVRA